MSEPSTLEKRPELIAAAEVSQDTAAVAARFNAVDGFAV